MLIAYAISNLSCLLHDYHHRRIQSSHKFVVRFIALKAKICHVDCNSKPTIYSSLAYVRKFTANPGIVISRPSTARNSRKCQPAKILR